MLEREFTVNLNNDEIEFFDKIDDECAQSICENNLEIPLDYIKKMQCYDDVFKVSLTDTRVYYRDDWYVNLARLDYVS